MLLNLKTITSSINNSWLNFKVQTKLLIATISLIAILLNSWSDLTMSDKTTLNNNNLMNDLDSIIGENLISLIEQNKENEIIPVCEQFYNNSSTIRYIIFIDNKGIDYSIPYSYSEIFPTVAPESLNLKSIVNNKSIQVSNIKIKALQRKGKESILVVGVNSTHLDKVFITNRIFLFLLGIFIIGISLITIFINVTITRPLIEISQGLKSIALGNFSRRIILRLSGELGNVISDFNELSRRLQLYDEKKNEQLLNERIKLESLIATISDGALLLNTNLQIVLINAAAIKIFGWKTKTRILGTPIWNHLPINLQKKMFVTLQDILFDAGSTTFDGKIDNESIQLPKRSIRISLNMVYDSQDINNFPIGIGVTVQDKTKELELDKIQNRFMSNISHELRTPLFNIKSFIETIQEYDYTLSNWQKRYFLDIVNKETDRLTRLVNDILCISKLDSNNNVSLDTMNLTQIVNQTIANYQIAAKDKNLYLHPELTSNLPNIKGNKDLLLQVITNLVGNALKFTYKNGEILIRVYILNSQKVRIEILDTGIGIASNYHQSIFQRFSRIEN